MDPMIVSLTARIIYEERLQSFDDQRQAHRLGGFDRLEMALSALTRHVRTLVRHQFGQPAARPMTATQEVACVNC